jgi:protein-S-isoprenylcysteine O-methyltransferase Ste14
LTTTQLVFRVVVFSEVTAIVAVLASLVWPAARVWPPPRRSSWQAWASWLFAFVTLLGPIALGMLDWDGWVIPGWVRLVAGSVLVPLGFGVGFWALGRLTFAASFGLKGELLTTGLYGLSRNPQTIGFIAGYVGFALLSNSELAVVAAALESVQLALLPFAEEPWLRAQFGEPYRDYARRVPRFLGRRRAGGSPSG